MLASVVFLYRISAYVLLSQFRWTTFTLNADIAFPTAYIHTPENGVFCGSLTHGTGGPYTITLPPATPIAYKKLFDYEIAGAITVSLA